MISAFVSGKNISHLSACRHILHWLSLALTCNNFITIHVTVEYYLLEVVEIYTSISSYYVYLILLLLIDNLQLLEDDTRYVKD